MEEGPGLFTKQQLARHISRRHFSATFLHIRGAESCYQPIYQNRSILPSRLPFFLPSLRQDRSNSPFPFRCFCTSLFLLNTPDIAPSLPVTRAALMSLLRLSHRVKSPLTESSGTRIFITKRD